MKLSPSSFFFAPLSCFFLGLNACMSTSEGDAIKKDMFGAKKRLLELEAIVLKSDKDSKSFGENASKQIASTGVDLENMRTDIMLLKGQVATLRAGIITGQLPDAKEEEDSLAKTLANMEERLAAIESSQLDMIRLLDKIQGKAATKETKKNVLKKANEFVQAFNKKSYSKITEDYPSAIKTVSIRSKEYFEIGYFNAESLFKLGNIRRSALAFNELYKELKKTKGDVTYAPAIQKRLGDCFRLLGDKKSALVFYKELVTKYQDSEEAADAKEMMEKLK